jgi:hypothetical protein
MHMRGPKESIGILKLIALKIKLFSNIKICKIRAQNICKERFRMNNWNISCSKATTGQVVTERD